MSCTYHGCKLALALGRIGNTVPKLAESASAREDFGCCESFILIGRAAICDFA